MRLGKAIRAATKAYKNNRDLIRALRFKSDALKILHECNYPENYQCALFLLDAVQLGEMKRKEIEKQLGNEMANLMDALAHHKLPKPKKGKKSESSREGSVPEETTVKADLIAKIRSVKAKLVPVLCANVIAELLELRDGLNNQGDKAWQRCDGGKVGQEAEYEALGCAFQERMTEGRDLTLFNRYKSIVVEVFGDNDADS